MGLTVVAEILNPDQSTSVKKKFQSQKYFRSKKNVGHKFVFSQKKNLVKFLFGQKNIWVKKNVGQHFFGGQQKMFSQNKNFGNKKISVKTQIPAKKINSVKKNQDW